MRNVRRVEVDESVAMKNGGHNAPSVFKYDIVEMADLADAARRLNAKQKSHASPKASSVRVWAEIAKIAPLLRRWPIHGKRLLSVLTNLE
jgi:hypothetical protein